MFGEHWDGERYFNPGGAGPVGFGAVLRWKMTTRPEKAPGGIEPTVPVRPPGEVADGRLVVTLVNHSTVLLQWRGLTVLTDPMWSERAGPRVPGLGVTVGPKRKRAPGVRWEDLPPVDVVLVSHNHYDHLDLPTLRRLAGRGSPKFVTPMGVGELLRGEGMGPVREVDWGDGIAVNGAEGEAEVHGVPAFHFSGRGVTDRNRTLWCGYVIKARGQVVYFAGDTALGPHFEWIREVHGAPDLALLPVGTFEPRELMSRVHMGPRDAVRAHDILGAGTTVGIHQGTFQLGDDHVDKAREELPKLAGGRAMAALRNGEQLVLDAAHGGRGGQV